MAYAMIWKWWYGWDDSVPDEKSQGLLADLQGKYRQVDYLLENVSARPAAGGFGCHYTCAQLSLWSPNQVSLYMCTAVTVKPQSGVTPLWCTSLSGAFL